MNYNLIILLINIQYYLAKNYNFACIYSSFEFGYYVHCTRVGYLIYHSEGYKSNNLTSIYAKYENIFSGYEKCEPKSTPDLEYYLCLYNIYHLSAEQVNLFSKLHMTILKCKDCEYTHNWKFKNPKLCTNKAEAEYYKTYNDCLLNYLNINDKDLNNSENCTRSCQAAYSTDNPNNITGYSNCVYNCYKDIAKEIIEFQPKVMDFNNNDGDKKSNTLSKFDSLSSISVIALTILALSIV